MRPSAIVLSPGPCTPSQAGHHRAGREAMGERDSRSSASASGHQAIGEAYGGVVIRADRVMHGKTSRITHDGTGLFDGLPDPLEVMRYHSLIVERRTAVLPYSRILATTG